MAGPNLAPPRRPSGQRCSIFCQYRIPQRKRFLFKKCITQPMCHQKGLPFQTFH
ncbi:hypothetical protein GQ55_5G214600 [Panicum hallii var. hallii]|uniref:Uncharacterized protein n=1 Tax=Panicum hallii var. hallii TaxID=1504633 RepID=A0A2T7DIR6_9POAL|nr:hypothetical protein GQ55_5G214600 [Panicum hallii var. hallii]